MQTLARRSWNLEEESKIDIIQSLCFCIVLYSDFRIYVPFRSFVRVRRSGEWVTVWKALFKEVSLYHTGEKTPPILTIVIGGKHEASNYFWELYYGGWIASNMYFLGHAGCVQVNGVRIAGASGIFKGQDFRNGHWERLPYNPGAMRSIYHIREYNIKRLSLLSRPTIFLSHDWPQSPEHHGNLRSLLHRKPYFKRDIDTGSLGSPPMIGLLQNLKPECGSRSIYTVEIGEVEVERNPDEIVIEDEGFGDVDTEVPAAQPAPPPSPPAPEPVNLDAIVLDDQEDAVEKPPPPPPPPLETKFLDVDKCLPKTQFLEVIDVLTPQTTSPPIITYDLKWLAITRAFYPYMSMNRPPTTYLDEPTARSAVEKELAWVIENVVKATPDDGAGERGAGGGEGEELVKTKKVEDVQVFAKTAPGPGEEGASGKVQPPHYPNPRTAAFCRMLDIENKVDYAR
ncbi:hypothetical protein EIP91_003416 [Steccherinum ochraceum]|uniref:Lariat debranching enzyme C-terminal domain-containing protein n=1 Tax=Steccherinum ochraceum TaxID=92696 RepID=A0A4R0RM99_9APHY|nr:hypothetical protein EIP91_003416 [Steccherinum ochraceum]